MFTVCRANSRSFPPSTTAQSCMRSKISAQPKIQKHIYSMFTCFSFCHSHLHFLLSTLLLIELRREKVAGYSKKCECSLHRHKDHEVHVDMIWLVIILNYSVAVYRYNPGQSVAVSHTQPVWSITWLRPDVPSDPQLMEAWMQRNWEGILWANRSSPPCRFHEPQFWDVEKPMGLVLGASNVITRSYHRFLRPKHDFLVLRWSCGHHGYTFTCACMQSRVRVC